MSAPVSTPVPVLPIAPVAATRPLVTAAPGAFRRSSAIAVAIATHVPLTIAALVSRLASEAREQALVLREDRVPAIVMVDVQLAVLSHRRSKGSVAFQQLERLD